jgi:hypothetical protein
VKTTIISVVLLASAAFAKPQPGLPFLLIWPTARSTALAGAVTGLADDPDAMFFNPAGLAFQSGVGATANYADWLPGLYEPMWHGYAAGKLTRQLHRSKNDWFAVGLEMTHLNFGDFGTYVEPDPPPPRIYVWRTSAAVAASVRFSDHLAFGLKAKYIRSNWVPEWAWKPMPELGVDEGSTGSTWACDVGALWKPSSHFSFGASVANLGPGISYPDRNWHDPSPTMLRLGGCWTPVNNRYVRLNVLPEWDKVLVGMFYDSANTKSFGRELQTEIGDAWKVLAIEATGFEILSIRLGYFEDRTWQRGGLVFGNDDGVTYHYGVGDVLAGRHLGKLKSVGLCWGVGFGYKDYFRLDVSSDAAIYDFPTKNWKLQLTCNDIGGLFGRRS